MHYISALTGATPGPSNSSRRYDLRAQHHGGLAGGAAGKPGAAAVPRHRRPNDACLPTAQSGGSGAARAVDMRDGGQRQYHLYIM